MTYRCIGHQQVREHAGQPSKLVQCTNESETPTNIDKPSWGFLCPQCSNAAPRGAKPFEDAVNVGAMQCDIEEYRDQVSSGFANGARRSYDGGDNE
jgi:hypothetical protein